MLGNLERSLLRLLGENISVQCHFQRGKEGLHTKVDPGQLTQIILNLVVNARDAMPRGGCLALETCAVAVESPEDRELGCEELPPGEYVRISVADNGMGMSDEVKEHLFEPFFTTKDEGRGSGLGLATSYGIVRQSGGHICVESELGKGTTVKIFLPKVPAPPAPGYKRPGANKLPTGIETILVLEDDISVRHISVRVLRGLGYEVLEAANGDDAQQLIAKTREQENRPPPHRHGHAADERTLLRRLDGQSQPGHEGRFHLGLPAGVAPSWRSPRPGNVLPAQAVRSPTARDQDSRSAGFNADSLTSPFKSIAAPSREVYDFLA